MSGEVAGENMELPGMRTLEERLHPLCGSLHPRVLRLVVSEAPMVVACDGCMALGLNGVGGVDPTRDDVRIGLTKMLEALPEGDRIETTVEKLLAWTGQPTWAFPCVKCDGTGKKPAVSSCVRCQGSGSVECSCSECGDDHERDCGECYGTGETAAEAGGETRPCDNCNGSGKVDDLPSGGIDGGGHHGVILGMVLDRRRLARILSCVTGPCVAWVFRDYSPWTLYRLHLRGPGWTALLMGVRKELDGVARFDPSE